MPLYILKGVYFTLRISFTHNYHNDIEYQRIIQELRALGIQPSGNKASDKARLQIEKNKLINKIAEKEQQSEDFLVTLMQVQEDTSFRQDMEEQRLGAKSVAELNRMYFGI